MFCSCWKMTKKVDDDAEVYSKEPSEIQESTQLVIYAPRQLIQAMETEESQLRHSPKGLPLGTILSGKPRTKCPTLKRERIFNQSFRKWASFLQSFNRSEAPHRKDMESSISDPYKCCSSEFQVAASASSVNRLRTELELVQQQLKQSEVIEEDEELCEVIL